MKNIAKTAVLSAAAVILLPLTGQAYIFDAIIRVPSAGRLLSDAFPVLGLLAHPLTGLFFIAAVAGAFLEISGKNYEIFSRVIDAAVSYILLCVFMPLIILCILYIKLDSRGPIFFRQKRIGFNRRKSSGETVLLEKRRGNTLGRPFTIYKLRSMYTDAEASGVRWASRNDSRITRAGRILRKLHLDELPQLYNVLRGDMKIVGPRPERPEFVGVLSENISDYAARQYIKPGVTGLAQVRYRYTDSIDDTKKKIKYDLLYLRKQNLILDIRILFRTVKVTLTGSGAH